MPPADDDNLHVRSSRVLLAGATVPAVVELAGADRRVVAIHAADDTTSRTGVHDVGDALVAPAPLDLHLHGAGGHVVPPGGDVRDVDAALAREGAPEYEWVATLPIPQRPPAEPIGELAAAACSIASVPGARCRGLRLEGLFLNPARAGVWPPESFRSPDVGLLAELHAAAHDGGAPLLVVDVAPELDGAIEFIARARELGIVASLAHTDATWEEARAAIDAGATLATHVWNAMRPVAHRDPGVVAAVLADPRVTCELICDGVHLHPGTIALSVAACGPGGWVAVSDASPFAGSAPGEYDWAGTTVTHDGTSLRDAAGRLAGSATLLWDAPAVLRGAGVDDVDVAIAIGAAPRRVLDPDRTLGLHVNDPVWIGEVRP